MNKEREVDAFPPATPESEANLFSEAIGASDVSSVLQLDDRAFLASLETNADQPDRDDVEHALERAAYLREILRLLTADDTSASLGLQEQETRLDAQSLAVSGAQSVIDILTGLTSSAEKGDGLGALADVIESAFEIGRCSSATRQAAVAKRVRKRGEIEQLRCKQALRAIYDADPRTSFGLHRETILAAVRKRAGKVSIATLDRALKSNPWA